MCWRWLPVEIGAPQAAACRWQAMINQVMREYKILLYKK
jgi:hypothetical protein